MAIIKSGAEQRDPASGETRFPARRGVVDRTQAWRSTCRAVLLRGDPHAATFLGRRTLARALVW